MTSLVLWAIIVAIALYAWRDWFVSACALVVLAAFMKHSDMPRTLGEIPGTNPWDLLFVAVMAAWIITRRKNPAAGLCPRYVAVVSGLFAVMMLVTFIRGAADLGPFQAAGISGFTTEYLLNSAKYLVLAALLFDGARMSRRNLLLVYGAIVAQVLMFVLMTWKYIPLEGLFEHARTAQGESAYRRRFQTEIGFHPNDIALVLVAGFWAAVAAAPLLKARRWWWKAVAAIAGTLTALAVVMTNSRGGYMAFVGVGLLFGLLRYRWLLAALPVAALIALAAFPTLSDRITNGFGVVDTSGSQVEDWDAVSGGRTTDLWPQAVEEIAGAPVAGQGRLTIARTDLRWRIDPTGEEIPMHPHNAYLEMLLDSGAVGLVVTLLLFVGVPLLAYARRQPRDPLLTTVLYAGLAGAATLLIMGMSGQTFWPREGVDTILYLYALMLAGSVTRPLPVTADAARYACSPLDPTFSPAHTARRPQALRR